MSILNPETIIKKIKSCLPDQKGTIALHEPEFSGNEWDYVKDCLDSGWVSSVGKYVDRFEAQLAKYTGVKRAVAVVNGTAALHIALMLSGVQSGDEVLAPDLTFIATINAIIYCGAVPHLVDVEEKTLGVDPLKLKQWLTEIAELREGECYNRSSGRRIKALIVMHTFGHPVDIDPLIELCEEYKIEFIEDAAESLGSFYKGRHTGSWGKLSSLSFNGNKIVTTGGGGAILTNDDELGKRAKHITTTAKIPHAWEYVHDQVGYNYRMPNINAALGCAQLEKLPEFLKRKRILATEYEKAFSALSGVRFFTEPDFARSNYWLNTLILDENEADKRDVILQALNEAGLKVRPAWVLMHKLPMFKDYPRMDLNRAIDLENRIINIPSSPLLKSSNVE